MTPHPQQKYIIEEADVEIIEMAFPKSSFVRHLRSHPHTPAAPETEQPRDILVSDEFIATIRNQTLDELRKIVVEKVKTGECESGWKPSEFECDNDICTICIFDWAVESLRTQEHERGDQR